MADDPFGFRFREWQVYKDARSFRMSVLRICRSFPKDERFALTDQVMRACSSILLNIAEGSNRKSDRDTCLFIRRALGSLDEVVACLDSALDSTYIDSPAHDTLLQEAAVLAKQLRAFATYLMRHGGAVNDKG